MRLDQILLKHGSSVSEPIVEPEKYPGFASFLVRNPALAVGEFLMTGPYPREHFNFFSGRD